MSEQARECPPDVMGDLVRKAEASSTDGLASVEKLIRDFPDDARLYFLQGSLLASMQQYPEATDAMRAAVDIDPHYEIARFQLGFLQFTSGDALAARATWEPLRKLPPDAPLRLFATGLDHLGRDEFALAIDLLRRGILLNDEIPAVNANIQLLLAEIEKVQSGSPSEEPISSTHFLLQKFDPSKTRH